jgi:hypothetical protein
MMVLAIYAWFVIELAWHVTEEQVIIVYHAKLIILWSGINAFVMKVNYLSLSFYNFLNLIPFNKVFIKMVLTIYAWFVIELAWHVTEEQVIIVYHAKITVLFLELNAFAILVKKLF